MSTMTTEQQIWNIIHWQDDDVEIDSVVLWESELLNGLFLLQIKWFDIVAMKSIQKFFHVVKKMDFIPIINLNSDWFLLDEVTIEHAELAHGKNIRCWRWQWNYNEHTAELVEMK